MIIERNNLKESFKKKFIYIKFFILFPLKLKINHWNGLTWKIRFIEEKNYKNNFLNFCFLKAVADLVIKQLLDLSLR